ncbi:hypothetical protein ACJIZ3_006814 [Penstemon smallii]|uniref:Patellin-4 n=1 Tax=Penstemon smallii TaxID=265156 RepID=A0ABD3S8S5_9LAMI
MAVEEKEGDARKTQLEVSQEPKPSENVKEIGAALKEGAIIDEGNVKAMKLEDEKEKKNAIEEKGSECLPIGPPVDKNKGENVKGDEKGDFLVLPSNGNVEENIKESEKGECSSLTSSPKGEEEPESPSLMKEENGLHSDLKEYEKKALKGLRSILEEAILSNKLFKEEVKKEEKKELSHMENSSDKKDESKKVGEDGGDKDNFKEDDEIFVDKGKSKVEEEEKKAEQEVVIDKDITLWGVPLLPSKGDKGTDELLFKFLRAREFKVNDAFEMLKNTLEWRKENKIDSIIEEDFGNEYDSMSYMKGLDREGHLVCYNIYGVFANDDVYNKTFGTEASRERFLRWRLQLMEKQIQKLDFSNGMSSLLQINDLKNTPGPSRRDLRLATKRAVGILQDNYPEFVARNIFINVPFWYYAFNALLSPFLTQRTKSKFVFSRPSRVTETLLKYISIEEIPIHYGGLQRESDPDFSTEDTAFEATVKSGATETIEIPAPEVGDTLIWDLTIIGWDVNYKEEFVPNDEGSYTIIVKKGRKINWQEESIRNTFKNNEPGKIVITIENGIFRKKRVLYRYKTKNPSASSS